ncbi:hypothetical protein WMY93_009277 [Mugilogobius chulae]|uniref:IRF tryptophan pentad repeat domain-containing protein n=1 Tax=Mugilogobius chulae TaxID=88201 RepID=A0AAW0PEW8_9GOBI
MRQREGVTEEAKLKCGQRSSMKDRASTHFDTFRLPFGSRSAVYVSARLFPSRPRLDWFGRGISTAGLTHFPGSAPLLLSTITTRLHEHKISSDTMPVERMRMRPWLEEQIDSCQIPGLRWVNKEKRIFQIPWMHAARHGWDLEKDAPLFMRWAIHTGKFRPGVDRPDPKTWKANFRCAMNSLPDIEEVKDKSIKKGTNAFRVYKMLSYTERNMRKGKKRIDKDMRIKGSKVSSSEQFSLEDGPLDYTKPDLSRVKQESSEETDSAEALQNSEEEHMVLSEQLPFVCQTVEVMTENSEEQTVSSSHSYPLQISPVSSYGSDTESDTEETHKYNSALLRSAYSSSVLRVPSCSLPSMSTFVSSNKPNFRVTSTRDPAPLISYHPNPWTPTFHPSAMATSSAAGHAHEMRASVIRKTSDVTSS